MMKVQYVSPFAQGAVSVLETLIGVSAERGQLAARPQLFTTEQVNIVCGITGSVEGFVLYGLSGRTALAIASTMVGQKMVMFDQLAASAIAELGNMITGNSAALLSEQGIKCDISPPTLIRGAKVKISTLDIPALVIPLTLGDYGVLEVNVSLQDRQVPQAA